MNALFHLTVAADRTRQHRGVVNRVGPRAPKGGSMRFWKSFAVVLVVLGLTAALSAQELKGRGGSIYGKVTDESGGPLPGVTVTLTGIGAPRTATSGNNGDFRFINLDPGTYSIKAELTGLSTVDRSNIEVRLAGNTELTIPMAVSGVSAAVT